MSKFVVQDRTADGEWDERWGRFPTLESAQSAAQEDPSPHAMQVVQIPAGRIVWSS